MNNETEAVFIGILREREENSFSERLSSWTRPRSPWRRTFRDWFQTKGAWESVSGWLTDPKQPWKSQWLLTDRKQRLIPHPICDSDNLRDLWPANIFLLPVVWTPGHTPWRLHLIYQMCFLKCPFRELPPTHIHWVSTGARYCGWEFKTNRFIMTEPSKRTHIREFPKASLF